MSDYDPRRFQLGLLDPAFEQLESGQQAISQGVERRVGNMREDRLSGLGNVQGIIEQGDEAASWLDPNDPEDAQVLEQWQQERSRLTEQVGTLPGPDLLEASVGATGSGALADLRRRARVAEQAREEDVARLEAQLEEGLIETRTGGQLQIANVNNAANAALQENKLAFTGDQNRLDRQWQDAMKQAQRDWQEDENANERTLRRALQANEFEFRGEEGEADRILERLRIGVEEDLEQQRIDIEQGRLNLAGQQFSEVQNQRAYSRLKEDADAIRDVTDDPERRRELEDRFIEDLMSERGVLTKRDISRLADRVRLPQSVESRLTDAQADVQEANEALVQARTAGVEAQTRRTDQEIQESAWSLLDSQIETSERMEAQAGQAAANGDIAAVDGAIARAESIVGNDRYPEPVQNAASAVLENQNELRERAQTNFERAGELGALTLDKLRAQVRNGELTNSKAQGLLIQNMAARFDTVEELDAYLDQKASRDDIQTIFGTDDVESARRLLRIEFQAQQRIEEEGDLAQQGEYLLANPDTQNPDAWREDVIEHFTQDGMWGPEGESAITNLVNAKLDAAQLDRRGALMELQRTAQTAANLAAQAGLYEMQGRAEVLEAESSQAAALLENLGSITDLMEGPLSAAQTEVEQLCGDMGASSPECQQARNSLQNVSGMFTDIINMTLQSIGFGGEGQEQPLMTRGQWTDLLTVLSTNAEQDGLNPEEAARQIYRSNPTVVEMYPDVFKDKYPNFELPNDQNGEGTQRGAVSRASGWIGALGPDDPEQGVDSSRYESREWMQMPVEEKARELRNDPAFQDFVRTAQRGEERDSPLTESELQEAARRFGVTQQGVARGLIGSALPDFMVPPNVGPQVGADIEGMRQILDLQPAFEPENQAEGGGRGSTPETPDTSNLRMNEATPELMSSLLQAETAGGAHRDENDELIVSDKNAVGAGQILPTTAWNPGGSVEPLIELSPADEREIQAMQAEKQAFESAGEWDRAREKREEMDEYIIDPEQNRAGVNYMDDVTAEQSTAYAESYFNDLLRQFNNNVELALAAYNTGPGNLRADLERARAAGDMANWKDYIPDETRTYVEGILADMNAPSSGEPEGEPQGRRRPQGRQQQQARGPRMNELGDLV